MIEMLKVFITKVLLSSTKQLKYYC